MCHHRICVSVSRELKLELQSQSDGLQLELKRKESGLQMLKLERERLSNQITVADETYSKEKQTLVEKIVELKRRKEQKDREVSVKEMEILQAKQELEQQQMCLSNRQQAIIELKGKVKQQVELQKEVKFQLSEKRREFLKVQSAVHEIENKIFRKTAAMQEHITHELRNEISILHQQVRERELLAEQDRLLRSKMVDDYATLTKENAMMQSRLLELNKQREIERVLKEESYTALSAGIMQFLAVKDHENHLKEEIQRYQELLEQEESTFRDLQDKLAEKENFLQASIKMLQLDEAMSALRIKHAFCSSSPSEKWDEISKMTKSMKNLK
nr:centrobin-like isoform X3 [Pogona vitticeps]